jgi:hypothetical protein
MTVTDPYAIEIQVSRYGKEYGHDGIIVRSAVMDWDDLSQSYTMAQAHDALTYVSGVIARVAVTLGTDLAEVAVIHKCHRNGDPYDVCCIYGRQLFVGPDYDFGESPWVCFDVPPNEVKSFVVRVKQLLARIGVADVLTYTAEQEREWRDAPPSSQLALPQQRVLEVVAPPDPACPHGVLAGDQPDPFVNGRLKCTECRLAERSPA